MDIGNPAKQYVVTIHYIRNVKSENQLLSESINGFDIDDMLKHIKEKFWSRNDIDFIKIQDYV